ncbi:MAG TPA: hypothetical protein VHY09_01130, partial [Candidatus Methylacidiphilales bacterium]|nr:hypothetical protein [Candidatus Methylacidiphilales bacterium]
VTTVYPTGVNPTDVQNVQAALNQGGTVLLKAVDKTGHAQSFNFGSWNASISAPANSQVTLVADVVITGEQVGANRTTILGGVTPITEVNSGVKATITGLKFVNPQWSAITLLRSNGVNIVNNEIAGVLPFLNSFGYTESSGIYLNGGGGTFTGNVSITGNYIHGLDGQYEFGVQAFSITTTTNILGNTIQVGYATDAAAGQVDAEALTIGRCPGASNITGNNIQIGPGVGLDGIAVYGPSTGAATIVGNEVSVAETAFCYEAIGVNGSVGAVQILANSIDTQSSWADAVALVGSPDRGTVTNVAVGLNLIEIDNSNFGAIGLYGAVTKSTVSLNLITGEAAFALSANSDGNPADIISSNTFLSNVFLGFTATDATLFLDTNTQNNVWRGPYATVINKGTGNTISKSLF